MNWQRSRGSRREMASGELHIHAFRDYFKGYNDHEAPHLDVAGPNGVAYENI